MAFLRIDGENLRAAGVWDIISSDRVVSSWLIHHTSCLAQVKPEFKIQSFSDHHKFPDIDCVHFVHKSTFVIIFLMVKHWQCRLKSKRSKPIWLQKMSGWVVQVTCLLFDYQDSSSCLFDVWWIYDLRFQGIVALNTHNATQIQYYSVLQFVDGSGFFVNNHAWHV